MPATEIVGFVVLGLVAALGALVAWASFGAFLAMSMISDHLGPVQCAESVTFDVLSIGLCIGALVFGVRLGKRRQTGFAIVVILCAVLGVAPATLCAGSILSTSTSCAARPTA